MCEINQVAATESAKQGTSGTAIWAIWECGLNLEGQN